MTIDYWIECRQRAGLYEAHHENYIAYFGTLRDAFQYAEETLMKARQYDKKID